MAVPPDAESSPPPLITDVEELRELYPAPAERAVRKQIDFLDHHCRAFIARSPFVLIATADGGGSCDVSPKGGAPGFVRVLDEQRLAIPDAPGNRRLDSFTNLLANPQAGLLFLIPGLGETLRVNGRCRMSTDARLLVELAGEGAGAPAALLIEVREVYLHCAKALIRSALWHPDTWPPEHELPSAAEILRDHRRADVTVEAEQAALDESYTQRLHW